jgi:predicted ATPase/Tfp pilus assembly protein PilF
VPRLPRSTGQLRPEPSRFLGREADLARLRAACASGRVVTIVGPAGIGKTRLALRYGITRRENYRSVWFFDVSDAADVDEMMSIALRGLGRDRGSGAAGRVAQPVVACERAFAARPGALVIIDNVEHLLPGAAEIITRWAEAVPDVCFVVTSRTTLDIKGEEVVALGPLALPPPGGASGDAVELFVQRVRGNCAEYAPPPDELARVAEVVRNLRGVPLAIELAAARVGSGDSRELFAQFGPPSLADAMDARATRHAIERAFALLAPVERETLAQCSIFRGPFTVDAAARVVRIGGGAALPVVDTVLALARKSILQVERYRPMCFTMSESVRSYATLALAASPEAGATEWRHAQYYLEVAATVADTDPRWLTDDTVLDRADLLATMRFGARARQPSIVLRTALALDALSMGAGLDRAELAHLDDALRAGAAGDLRLVARALGARSGALVAMGRLAEARRDAETALRLATELDDQRQMGAMLRAAGHASFQLGDLARGEDQLRRALAIEEERGDLTALATVHYYLGSLHQSRGDAESASESLQRALATALVAGDPAAEMRALMGLAWGHFEAGRRANARSQFDRALAIARRLEQPRSERICMGYLGLLEFEAGDLTAADARLRQAIRASGRAGDVQLEGIFEGVRGGVLSSLDRLDEACEAFSVAADLLSGNSFYAAAIAIHRGHLDLAEARAATASGDLARATDCVADARERIATARADGDGPSLVSRSDDARMAVRILERALQPF